MTSVVQINKCGAARRPAPKPVVDLFAGPGGLGEGFSALRGPDGLPVFRLAVSIEKDAIAHRTLSLRSMFRFFEDGTVPDCYYDYLRGAITRKALESHPAMREAYRFSLHEARCATLGVTPARQIDGWIAQAVESRDDWVLIGGPPCQAYSLVGRSRMRGSNPAAFEKDTRHFLYKEYFRILRKFHPAVFVLENVKGILSSRVGGSRIFERIVRDLSAPRGDLRYEVRAVAVPAKGSPQSHADYVIRAERYGIPQARHRVILVGVRSDFAMNRQHLREAASTLTLSDALRDLPALRSCLSREPDTHAGWMSALQAVPRLLKAWKADVRPQVLALMQQAAERAARHDSRGGAFVPAGYPSRRSLNPFEMWVRDERLGGFCNHETRGHMRSDLHRYFFSACYAGIKKRSPGLLEFPEALLPEHRNVRSKNVPFLDRFRVQLADSPATTVVSHISKDGHYFIHPDPAQCRSLTVREAARLQTFPDNYFFEGDRTQQYVQVGNAVPPLLARELAALVSSILSPRWLSGGTKSGGNDRVAAPANLGRVAFRAG